MKSGVSLSAAYRDSYVLLPRFCRIGRVPQKCGREARKRQRNMEEKCGVRIPWNRGSKREIFIKSFIKLKRIMFCAMLR